MRGDGFSKVQAAPAIEGDKIMRLHAQTAEIEGGFVLFPKEAPWLDTYIHELVSFPNAKNDDQVDSTVFALAWSTPSGGARGWLQYYGNLVEELSGSQVDKNKMIRVRVPPPASTYILITGREVNVPDDRIIEVSEEELIPLLQHGATRVESG